MSGSSALKAGGADSWTGLDNAALAKLAEDGIQPEKPPYRPGGRTEGPFIAFVRDPDDYRVELIGRG